MPFKPSEIATLIVNGKEYQEWETVWAQERWNESFAFFRFTTAERPPIPTLIEDIPVAPCDSCVIKLGGVPAINGYIMQRQVAYDATRHQVMLIGKATTFWPAKSSITTEQANMDGLNIKQIADKLINPFGVNVQVIGQVDMTPFDQEQASPGQNIWEYLDKLVRHRAALLGSNSSGDLLLIGDHDFGGDVVDVLMEGVNIKKMQATISIEDMWSDIETLGQTAGSDQQNGPAANELKGYAKGQSCVKAQLVIPVEEPVKSEAELYQRAYFEAKWTDGTKITCLITVQGWFSKSGLWHAGQDVSVFAPMVPVEQVLKIKTCTWTQDSENGTETVLECVNPWALNDDASVNVGNPSAMSAPEKPVQVQPQIVPGGITSLPPD
jgi:prophage tail gpP-like protein